MTISATARMSAAQQKALNNMNRASQLVGGLGARLDSMQYDGLPVVAAGTLVAMHPVKYSLTPYVGTATKAHAAVTLGASAADVTTAITQPDYPRNLSIKGNAGGISGDVVITGTDFAGVTLTETIALNAATEVLGTKAFKTITNIHLPAKTNGSGDTVSIGMGNSFGFPVAIPNAGLVLVKSFSAGAADTGTVTASATIPASVFAINGTPDGTKVLDLIFLA